MQTTLLLFPTTLSYIHWMFLYPEPPLMCWWGSRRRLDRSWTQFTLAYLLLCLFIYFFCFKSQGWRDLSLPQMGGRPVSKSKSQDGIQTSAMSFFLPFLLGPPPRTSI